jgi:hypothetical protein
MTTLLAKKVADVVEAQGWDDTTVLNLCFIYIENQQDDEAFIDFVRGVAEDEVAHTSAMPPVETEIRRRLTEGETTEQQVVPVEDRPLRPYICGSISNGGTADEETRERNLTRFFEAEERLRQVGLEPINPARRGSRMDGTWLDYMREGLRDIAECDGVAYLLGWTASTGAAIEVDLVRALGLPVDTVDVWVEKRGRFHD